MAQLEATIIVGLGYGNTEATISDLRQLYAALRRYAAPTVDVLLRPFDSDWRHIADRIHQDSSPRARTIFIGHSYGCGWGLRRFARFMDDNGRLIHLACLVDPVIRWFQVLRPLNFLALTRLGEFHLPSNVAIAHVWRQVNNRPPGRYVISPGRPPRSAVHHRVVFGSREALRKRARCNEEPIIDATVTHSSIDGLPLVQREIQMLVEGEMAAVVRGRQHAAS